ncbi:3-oxoacyl-reductase [Clathrospora elynae]|uniref:3-oxoacyl-reductase n=1 Tax=Clathrospora elynae TaxID=706981 RepID=A0A6A5SYQ9_9PLEO|nr:3-oxoacyl-reductase [Clathrospora elynae]
MAAARPRHVLITGGSRGIGLAIAQLFAKNAYRCTLISRSEDNLKAAVATLHPLPSYPIPSEQTSAEETQKLHNHTYIPGNITPASTFWSTTSHFGTYLPKPPIRLPSAHPSRIDVVVNCAGITQAKLFTTLADATMDKIITTNLTSLMQGTKFLLRHGYLRGYNRHEEGEQFSPVVINVASLLGVQGGYGAVAYAASKAGVLGFTRALATEYASHKVRVNAIVPGYIETDMTKDLNASELQQRIPLGRFGKPDEIAQAALFLAENQYAHNCVINLDGGVSAV